MLPLLPLVVAPPCAHFLGGQSPTGEGRGVRLHGIGVLYLNFNLGQFLYLGRKHDRMPTVLLALVKSHMIPCIGNVQQGQSCGSEKAPDILQPGPNSFSTKTQSPAPLLWKESITHVRCLPSGGGPREVGSLQFPKTDG